jgi:hypothetical protein
MLTFAWTRTYDGALEWALPDTNGSLFDLGVYCTGFRFIQPTLWARGSYFGRGTSFPRRQIARASTRQKAGLSNLPPQSRQED